MEKLSKFTLQLEQTIHYKFNNIAFAEHALTHPSYQKSNFELLEFMGDRVLNLCVAQMIWNEKHTSERECAENLATRVNKYALLEIAKLWKLERCVLFTAPKEQINTILVDACEAIIGAVFLDGGWNNSYKIIERDWPKDTMSFIELDPKSILQKWTHKMSHEYKYTLIHQSGPAHNPKYTVELTVHIYKTIGVSNSIRTAEKNAALKFLKKHTDLYKKYSNE
ncbi:MAG: hypothetical protein H6845_01005 [Alphaproteobacteria bacterium]|nr:MAG: hypothetical protein H6845_01005 [Alphaproteobacteria bacterium]